MPIFSFICLMKKCSYSAKGGGVLSALWTLTFCTVSNTPAVATNGNRTLHQAKINGVKIEVIKSGNEIVAGYPVGHLGYSNWSK